jgi:NAD-dependent SIR2 family protein deacetylase
MSTWQGHKASSLSSIETFNVNPGLVWQYMADRKHLALQSEPNNAYEALAKLAKKKPGFVCLTQNIDGNRSNEFSVGAFANKPRTFEKSKTSQRPSL